MDSTMKSRVATLSLCIAAMTATESALAQLVLEEVVVTAQRRAQSLQDVPVSVNAMQSDLLDQNSITSLADIGKIAPSLSISSINSEPTQPIGIRGVATAALGVGVEASTAVFIDGVYQRDLMSVSMLSDVEQIEILKGPQGTLFGRNAAAGAVNVKTRAPEDTFGGKVAASVGNEGYWRLYGLLNLPINDQVLTRTNLTVKQRDGWMTDTDSPQAKDLYETEALAFRSRLTWLLNDAVTLGFSVDYQEDEGTRGGVIIERAGTLIPNGAFAQTHDLDGKQGSISGLFLEDGAPVPGDAYRDLESGGVSVQLDWDLSDALSLASITAYRDSTIKLGDGSSGLFTAAEGVFPFLPAYVGFEEYGYESFSQEFRLSGTMDAIDWFVGANYFQDNSSQLSNFAIPALATLGIGTGALGDVISDNEVEIESYALFGDAIFAVSDTTNITLGIRYSYDEKTVGFNDVDQAAPDVFFADVRNGRVTLTDQVASVSKDWDNVSGRLVVDHRVFDDTLVYASVSQGYKAGGFNSQLSPGVDAAEAFDTEESINYELGWKSTLAGGAVTFNGAVFYNEYDNYQFQVGEPGALGARNVGADVEISGADFDLAWLVSESFTLSASGTFLSSEFVQDLFVTGPGGTQQVVADGQELARAPDFAGLINADYLHRLPSGASLRFNLSYSYTEDYRLGNIFLDNFQGTGLVYTEDDIRADSYALVNGRVTFADANEQWSVSLWGKNLTDESYREGSRIEISNAVYGEIASSVHSTYRNEPRMYGIDVEYAF